MCCPVFQKMFALDILQTNQTGPQSGCCLVSTSSLHPQRNRSVSMETSNTYQLLSDLGSLLAANCDYKR